MPSELENAALRYRAALLRREREASSQLVRAYGEAWRNTSTQLAQLQRQIREAQAAGEIVGPSWLGRVDRLQALQRQIEAELRTFADFADGVTLAGQRDAIDAALQHSAAMARLAGPEVGAVFNQLPASAIENMLGYASDGSPLRALFDALGPSVSQGVRDALTTALATGMNPRETARAVRRAFGMGLNRALRIARTEQIRAYREATRRNYENNSDIIAGWQWMCACDRRSCASCWAMHGSIHSVKETLDDHPNGRCTMLPIVKGFKNPLQRMGAELFDRLPESDQRHILGNAMKLAYDAGEVVLDPDYRNDRSIVGRTDDPQWGTMRYARSLQAIVGRARAQELISEARR